MRSFAYNAGWEFMIALGCAIFALGFDLFLEPNGLTAGGISGIALILRAQQRMQMLEGSVLVRNVPQQARRVLDAAGVGRLVTIK